MLACYKPSKMARVPGFALRFDPALFVHHSAGVIRTVRSLGGDHHDVPRGLASTVGKSDGLAEMHCETIVLGELVGSLSDGELDPSLLDPHLLMDAA